MAFDPDYNIVGAGSAGCVLAAADMIFGKAELPRAAKAAA